MKVEAFSEDGKSLIDEKGELVCTEPFPAMPIYFWNDKKGEKYKKAYFSKFKDVWTHGDYHQDNQNRWSCCLWQVGCYT